MNFILLKLFKILFLGILISFFISCHGQSTSQVIGNSILSSIVAKGDTVYAMGKSIWYIFQDKNNNYWFGSDGNGVYKFDGYNTINYTTKDGLCDNRIRGIQEDRSGNLYFNTMVGSICKFDGHRFTAIPVTNTYPAGEGWKLEPEDLWFQGSQDLGAVFRYDGKELHSLKFPKTKLGEDQLAKYPRAQYPNMRFNPYDVYSIYKDTKGNIWFGSGLLGVCRYNGKSIDWISEDDVNELHDGPSNGVRSIIEDKDGNFWFSNTLYHYKIYDSKTPDYTQAGKDKTEMKYVREKSIGNLDGSKDSGLDFYMSAVKDSNDDLWIATYNDGIWKYDGKTTKHYSIMDGNKVVTVFSIYKDKAGVLWLGTHEYGVWRFDGKEFKRFTVGC